MELALEDTCLMCIGRPLSPYPQTFPQFYTGIHRESLLAGLRITACVREQSVRGRWTRCANHDVYTIALDAVGGRCRVVALMDRRSQLLAGILGALAFFVLPTFVSAAENIVIRTNQVIPQGAQTCTQPAVSNIQAFVYGDGLNSFEFTISDRAYVALAGSVGETPLPFNLMTRKIDGNGHLRVHVDVPLSSARGTVPASIVLLSGTGQAVCLTTVSFTVQVGQMQDVGITYPPVAAPTGSTGGNSGVPTGGNASSSTGTSTGTSTGVDLSTSSLGSLFGSLCTAGQGAFELWFVLLALFIVLVAFAALGEVALFERYRYAPIGIIIVAALLLAAFWYYAANCRTEAWAPFLLIVITALGLVIAFRNTRTIQVIELPPARD